MKKLILMTCISALTLTFSLSSHAKIYKWTDAKGVVHYSATPPVTKKKAKQEVKNIESEIRMAAGKPQSSPADNNNTQKNEDEENEQETDDSESELSAPDKKLIDYCKTQKNNLANLKNNFRNVWVDTSGKKTKLDQKQRQEKVDYLKSRIKNDCQEVKTG